MFGLAFHQDKVHFDPFGMRLQISMGKQFVMTFYLCPEGLSLSD
jgi:hypothetical protein